MVRVNVMHPNGEILFSFSPEHFDAGLVRRIWSGQVRARIAGEGEASVLEFVGEAGESVLFRERVEAPSLAEPRDGAER